MNSIHYQKIAKRTFERLWDTLSVKDQKVVVNDTQKQTELSQWFYNTVESTAKSKYESPDYWMNNPETFKHSKHQAA